MSRNYWNHAAVNVGNQIKLNTNAKIILRASADDKKKIAAKMKLMEQKETSFTCDDVMHAAVNSSCTRFRLCFVTSCHMLFSHSVFHTVRLSVVWVWLIAERRRIFLPVFFFFIEKSRNINNNNKTARNIHRYILSFRICCGHSFEYYSLFSPLLRFFFFLFF